MLVNPKDIQIDWEQKAKDLKIVVLEMSTIILKLDAEVTLIKSIQDKKKSCYK